jgi:hypothetical protein
MAWRHHTKHLPPRLFSLPCTPKIEALVSYNGLRSFIFLFVPFFLVACTDGRQTAAALPAQNDSEIIKRPAANPYLSIDLSPADIIYFPVDYPVIRMSEKGKLLPVVRVIYSRPHKQGRKIFGSLLKYGEPWRLGANEATEIEFFNTVTIQNKKIEKGRYILYCIPQTDSWTIVFNSNVYSWGLTPDSTKDLYRFTIPVEVSPVSIEYFTMVFQKSTGGANLIMAWDDVVARLPLSF